MSATLFEEPAVRSAGAARATEDHRRGPTLESLLSGVWEGLASHRSVACPACGEAEMRPRYGAGGGGTALGGRCSGCGTVVE